MAQFVAVYVPGLLDEKTKLFERQMQAFCVDGVGAILGACLGMSPIVAYIESASGIRYVFCFVAGTSLCCCWSVVLLLGCCLGDSYGVV